MKESLFILLNIVLIAIITPACISSKHTVIVFDNKSGKSLDSVVVHIQNYKFSFKNIKPNTKTNKVILKDSIILNKRDIMIRAHFYDKDKSDFKGGFYYNDLSRSLNNSYILILDKNLNATIDSD